MSNEKPPDAIPEHETVESARSVDQDQTLRAGGDQLTSLATMRHALRTPLNHIIGYSEMLLEEAGERHLDDFAADIQKIRTAGRQLMTLINDLLEPMSTQAASPALAPKTTGSSALLGDPEPGSRPSAEDRGPAPETLSSRLLVVDDNASNRDMLSRRLKQQGYDVSTAESGRQALEWVATQPVDLVLLDVMMPEMNGYEVLEHLKANSTWRDIPVIMISALDEIASVVRCIEKGAEDYLPKPFDPVLLRARIGACLEKKRLRDEEVRHLHELAEWNRTLEQRVQEEVAQVERLGRLKRFFSPQLAEMIVDGGADDPLKTHRRDVAVVFLDLRGFTVFAETSEPEEIMGVLREYHAEMGKLILEHEGTLERFTGDGMMIFFNDPVPIPNPAERAIRMAIAMRDRVKVLSAMWRKRGYDLVLGIGVAQGYATIGAIGFEGRRDYGAIGTVTNLAARLCGEAKGGQILVPPRVAGAVEDLVDAEEVGPLALKGLLQPVPTYNVLGLKGQN